MGSPGGLRVMLYRSKMQKSPMAGPIREERRIAFLLSR